MSPKPDIRTKTASRSLSLSSEPTQGQFHPSGCPFACGYHFACMCQTDCDGNGRCSIARLYCGWARVTTANGCTHIAGAPVSFQEVTCSTFCPDAYMYWSEQTRGSVEAAMPSSHD